MVVLYLKGILGPALFVGVVELHWFRSHRQVMMTRGGFSQGFNEQRIYDNMVGYLDGRTNSDFDHRFTVFQSLKVLDVPTLRITTDFY